MKQPHSILITGASSGIGKALAHEYAAPGMHLVLTGRNHARLEEVKQCCIKLGASVNAHVIDVTDQAAMADLINQSDKDQPLDLIIANAGISGGSGGTGEDEAQARAIFDINFGGVINTIWPAIHLMKKRKRGQIAMVSSIAGMTPQPGAPAYSASKAAVKAYGEALNGSLRADGITVSTICPGFVKSRITDKNDFPMPMFMDAAKAARIIRRGLVKGRILIFFPWRLAAIVWVIGLLPPSWRVALLSRMPKKG